MPDDHVVSEPALRRFAQRLRTWLPDQIETLDPGSFALVMATGIISNALFFETRPLLSDALFAANLVAYRGHNTHHLDMGHIVDSTLSVVRNLEAHLLARSAELYASALEPRIPAWHVCPGELACFACGGLSPATVIISYYALDCAHRMGSDRQRACSRVVAELSC